MQARDNEGQIARKISGMLLKIGSIKINPETPFTWSSGWLAPIYCDNRLALSFPTIRNFIKEQLAETVNYYFPTVEAIAGVATAGISQGALVADLLGLPFLYVRSKPKGHGMENLVEGRVVKDQRVVVIEDLISTGGSALKAAEGLRTNGMQVLGMVAIFTYGLEASIQNFRHANIELHSLSNYQVLIEEAVKQNYVSSDKLESLRSWREMPDKWKPESGPEKNNAF